MKPRWWLDYTLPTMTWPLVEGRWQLTISAVKPHEDSIGRVDGLQLSFAEPGYHDMLVPLDDIRKRKLPTPGPGMLITMDHVTGKKDIVYAKH